MNRYQVIDTNGRSWKILTMPLESLIEAVSFATRYADKQSVTTSIYKLSPKGHLTHLTDIDPE